MSKIFKSIGWDWQQNENAKIKLVNLKIGTYKKNVHIKEKIKQFCEIQNGEVISKSKELLLKSHQNYNFFSEYNSRYKNIIFKTLPS